MMVSFTFSLQILAVIVSVVLSSD